MPRTNSLTRWRTDVRRSASQGLSAVALLLCMLAWAGAATAAVSARFDRPQVYLGDTLTLHIESDDLGGGTPDLSALEADFDVLGTASGSRVQIINGRHSASRNWQVTLAPKRAGTLEVAPIPVGDEQTQPLRLTVAEAPAGAAGAPGDELFLEVEVGRGDGPVMVQQQIPLTVRLFSAVPLRVGELTEPRPEGGVLERLGEDVQYDTRRNGREYRVVERRFSLSPERSGELRIPPVTFTGELPTADGGFFGDDRLNRLFRDPVFERFGGGLFERGESVRVRSRAVTLDVQPQPEDFMGRYWLPASALAIEDSWDGDAPQLAVGEPVTRKLTITATGLAGSQIPRIEVPAPDGVRVYSEPADAETRTDGERLFGVSRQQVTLMPTAAGTLRFPEIRLRWWDVGAGRERTAVVPARTFTVAGSNRGGATTAGADAALPGQGPAPGAAAPAPGEVVPDRLAQTRRPGAVILLVAVGLLLVVWLWRRLGRRTAALGRTQPARVTPGRDAAAPLDSGAGATPLAANRRTGGRGPLARLHTACAAGDARGAAAALPLVLREHWGPGAPASLGAMAARLERDATPAAARAAAAIRTLEAVLYGPQAGQASWRGAELAAAVPDALRAGSAGSAAKNAAEAPLAPLYPRRG
jgi:hypothetical protein